MTTKQPIAWGTSTVMHALLLAALAMVRTTLEHPDVTTVQGGVVLQLDSQAAMASRDKEEWHVHAFGIESDHVHQHAGELLIHKHPRHVDSPDEFAPADLERLSPVVAPPLADGDEPPRETSVPPRRNHVSRQLPIVHEASSPHAQPAKSTDRAEPALELARVDVASIDSVSSDRAGALVDELPKKLDSNPAPPYPADAYARRQQGSVLLEVRVNERGDVERVKIAETSGVESLDRAAQDTVRRWRFRPAKRNAVAVPFTVTVPIRFAIRGAP